MPKGYAKIVDRLRKSQERKQKLELEDDILMRGDRYAKVRLNLDKPQPPSFVKDPEKYSKAQRKNQLVMSIDVSVSPHK